MKLQNGLGLIDETSKLLDLWTPEMSSADLRRAALISGRFPNITARRLQNIVNDCFAPRYLVNGGAPAISLKSLKTHLTVREFSQFLFLYTCRAHQILADFIREIYWPQYQSPVQEITNQQATTFVQRLVREHKTANPWSEGTIKRAACDLTGCCTDFGLLEKSARSKRKIIPFRLSSKVAVYLAYELHFLGTGDNAIIEHPDWGLFGLSQPDVLSELKRLALRQFFILQSAGTFIRITWTHSSMEALCDVLAKE